MQTLKMAAAFLQKQIRIAKGIAWSMMMAMAFVIRTRLGDAQIQRHATII